MCKAPKEQDEGGQAEGTTAARPQVAHHGSSSSTETNDTGSEGPQKKKKLSRVNFLGRSATKDDSEKSKLPRLFSGQSLDGAGLSVTQNPLSSNTGSARNATVCPRSLESGEKPKGWNAEGSGVSVKLGATIKKMLPFILVGLFYLPLTGGSIFLFPFLRSLVVCDEAESPDIDRSSGNWSGSSHCGDRIYVAETAQEMEGIGRGIEFSVMCLARSLLGVAADTLGRKVVMIFAFSGAGVNALCFYLATMYHDFTSVFLALGFIISGISSGFFVSVNASVSDRSAPGDRPVYFAILMTSRTFIQVGNTLIILFLVVSQNLDDYSPIWLGYAIAAMVGASLVLLFYPETRPREEREPWSWEKINPFVSVRVITDNSYLLWICIAGVLCTLGASVGTIFAAFSITEFGWTQTQATGIVSGSLLVAAIGMGLAFPLVQRIGASRTLLLSFGLLSLGSLVLCFSQFSPAIFLIGLTMCSLGSLGGPSFSGIISTQVANSRQGELQGVFGALALGAVALGAFSYSAMFASVGPQYRYVPFAVACAFFFAAFGTFLRLYQVHGDPVSTLSESQTSDVLSTFSDSAVGEAPVSAMTTPAPASISPFEKEKLRILAQRS